MKILFLIKSLKTPSSRIRAIDLVPELKKNEIDADIEILPDSFLKRARLFKKASSYPVVILQKRLLNYVELKILRKTANFLIFDFDDAIYHRNASPSTSLKDYISHTRERKFKRTVLCSDMVLAANNVLAKKVRKIDGEKPLAIIPSSINTVKLPVKNDYALSNPIVIGWTGTRSTLRYLEYILPSLKEVSKKHDFILNIIADKSIELPGINTRFTKWDEKGQFFEISQFDIGIMPLSQDPFSEGKASYKLLQYMAAGVPSVCSAVGMNNEVSENNEFCLKASDPSEFSSQIIKLIEDNDLREEMGLKGMRLVNEKYSLSQTARKLAAILLKL